MTEIHQIACFGRDHGQYGQVHMERVGDRSAVAISVGSDPNSPSKRYKGDKDHLNEDALFLLDNGDHCVLAVADAHFGWSSSHTLIEQLRASLLKGLPTNAAELAERIAAFQSPPSAFPNSDSTLVVTIVDRRTKQGFGVSYGDSSIVLVGPGQSGKAVNPHNSHYVSCERPYTLEARRAKTFHFLAEDGDLILAFTDGIDECAYRQPERSLQPKHLLQLYQRVGAQAKEYAEALMDWALRGVDGGPGGQDNIALIVTAL